MFAGAISMIPGGLGSIEATIAGILMAYGSGLAVATLAALGIGL
jgi:uncharacterized membrane protein YbhN (UPF0104 family)